MCAYLCFCAFVCVCVCMCVCVCVCVCVCELIKTTYHNEIRFICS